MSKKAVKKKKTKRRKTDHLDLIARHLKLQGWKVVVIGGERVQQDVGANRYNFEYVVKFTGGKIPTSGSDS